MTRAKPLAALFVLLTLLAFLAGYWPQRQLRVSAEDALAAARVQLNDLEARDRLSRLLGSLLTLQDSVTAQNFGEAAKISSQFFDAVQAETARATAPAIRSSLASILQRRDGVTSALARGEGSVADVLRQTQLELRRTLGFGVPAEIAGR